MGMNKLKNLIIFIIKSGLSLTSIQFVFVGMSCLIFAEAVLYFFVDILRLNSIFAVIVATELSVLLNFYINDNWTFRKSKNVSGSFMSRLIKFHVSRIASILVNIGLFALLNEVFLIHYLLSYFLAALVAFAINFITSILWVWRMDIPTYR
jgi:dolichol-phosphate mannosyltransferase